MADDNTITATDGTAATINNTALPDGAQTGTIGDEGLQGANGDQAGNTANAGDGSENAQAAIIEQQQSTIDALLARTEQLTKQLNILVSSGVQITDSGATAAAQTGQSASETKPDDYVSLADLGKEIGKR